MATTATQRTASAQPNAWKVKELGCMWKREKKASKEKYLTGVLNLKNIPGFPDQDVPIVVFSNRDKQKDTHPDLRIYVSEKRDAAPAAAAPAASARRTTTTAAAPATAPAPAGDPNDLI